MKLEGTKLSLSYDGKQSATLSRREMLQTLAISLPLAFAAPSPFAADVLPRRRLGIGMHSYGFNWRGAKDNPASAKFSDALEFLKYAKHLGAGGVQVTIGSKDSSYAKNLRAEAESSETYFEAQASLPKQESDIEQFEKDVRLAKEAGAEVMRTALLGGRRYETFESAGAFHKFREQSWQSLLLAEPILKRHRLRLAIENHKDWLVAEFIELLRKLNSEFVGVCVDTGNNLALLEEPMSVVEALAPFAFSSHIKDMAVQEYSDGFLLSEVPLGRGFLDLPRMISVLSQANPKIQFNLEMITRDPLRIPCLTEKYWATMSDAPASRLASMLAIVHQHGARNALPHTTGLSVDAQLAAEDENVRESLRYARTTLSL